MAQGVAADPGKATMAVEQHTVTLLRSIHNLGALFLNPLLAQERKALVPFLLQQHFYEKGFIHFIFFYVVNQILHYSIESEF